MNIEPTTETQSQLVAAYQVAKGAGLDPIASAERLADALGLTIDRIAAVELDEPGDQGLVIVANGVAIYLAEDSSADHLRWRAQRYMTNQDRIEAEWLESQGWQRGYVAELHSWRPVDVFDEGKLGHGNLPVTTAVALLLAKAFAIMDGESVPAWL